MTDKNYLYQQLRLDQSVVDAALVEWGTVHSDLLYDISTQRESMSPALSKTRAYHLRISDVEKGYIVETTSAQHILACRDTVLMSRFPAFGRLIDEVGQAAYGGWKHVGRVFVTRLDPSARIGRHVDEGEYFDKLHRVHLVLKSAGSKFMWDTDSLSMEQGGVYVVNNSLPHWVENSDQPRTHLIFDAA